jgi:hypothetical protein
MYPVGVFLNSDVAVYEATEEYVCTGMYFYVAYIHIHVQVDIN